MEHVVLLLAALFFVARAKRDGSGPVYFQVRNHYVLLVIVAVVCLVLSLVVQLGESIRYQNAPAGSQITYTARELALSWACLSWRR